MSERAGHGQGREAEQAGLPEAEGTGIVWQRTTPFLEAHVSPATARTVIAGIPLDHTTSFRPGTREAPRRIRDVSDGLESFSPGLHADLADLGLGDYGDLILPWGNVENALATIEQAGRTLLHDGRRVLTLGGEHLLTLGMVRAALARWPDLAVVQLDAHLDLRDTYLGERLSHATVMRRILEMVGPGRVVPMGVRSGIREEWAMFEEIRSHLARELSWRPEDPVARQARAVAEWLKGRPFYLTIDIDVADPAAAPGTGTPEPGGPSAAELLEAVRALAGAGPVAVDVVEVCPSKDPSDITALLAAKIVREVLLAAAFHVRG
ncbi:agmatinase [Carboxydochorda subterranea]|uniref:Agmatinase n=1 Tax=Carboxydichorda subterranea TaxID=3109565 RepID=A0ABZ1BV80_9FIRM|nr:agmatinase [Limnochorda sp. L945t]WRP16705.1 agmatinase [Limnochorda sp. L945t]